RREGAPRARDDRHSHLGIIGDVAPDAGELGVQALVGRVHPLGAVDRDQQHAAAPPLEAQVLVAVRVEAAHPAIVSPPLTLSTCPVTNPARSDAKKAIASATSSGAPSRPIGIARRSASCNRSDCARNSGVSVGPGHTTLAVIPCLAVSRANDLVKAITPPFAPA